MLHFKSKISKQYSPDTPDLQPICLVLGAGGARGLAHLGVMQALAERQTVVGSMLGVSMGALMSSLCAITGDPQVATDQTLGFLKSSSGRKIRAAVLAAGGFNQRNRKRTWGKKLFHSLKQQAAFSRAINSKSLLPSTILRDAIDHLIPDVDIRDVPIDLQIIAVDLELGRRVVLREGSLRRAIRASMSIPGIFPAVRWEDMWLNDIGNYDTVPCDVARLEQQFTGKIVAVDVGPDPMQPTVCDSAMDSMVRASAIAETIIRQKSLPLADLVIRPKFESQQWYDFGDLESLIELGYREAQNKLAIRVPASSAAQSR